MQDVFTLPKYLAIVMEHANCSDLASFIASYVTRHVRIFQCHSDPSGSLRWQKQKQQNPSCAADNLVLGQFAFREKNMHQVHVFPSLCPTERGMQFVVLIKHQLCRLGASLGLRQFHTALKAV